MKKVCSLVFFFSIFLLSFSFFSFRSYAAAGDLSATPSSQQINYDLPYPGLLPDSPLYFLRIIRDRVVGFLISDPLKKSEFDLLQADKRLNAGIYLFNKGKISLSISTISKAENYFGEAIDKMEEAKKQGEAIKDMREKLNNASEKHEQELGILTGKADGKDKSDFENESKRITNFEQRLSQ